ncbi:arylsulfatase [Streptomyces violens]|uniref:arylsulfatase n=1 Tax=Streptomyces violens TaxID=66377 RepID=UPI0004C0F6B6|nr:arylsulfatase [Streptomyces violens]
MTIRRDPYEGFPGHIARTFAASEPAWPVRRTAPAGAPNIVVVLVDDMGYSDIGPFGSEIPTPTLDHLADQGVRLSNYHTMPLCSPARAALLTGLNPHRVGYAHVANSDPGFPGYGMTIAEDVPTLAELLHDQGYATYAVGKWHLVRDSASNAADDRANWPLQKGFDRYYGVLEGLTSLFHPHQLVRDNSPLDIDELPEDYYYTDDLTDQALSMIKGLRAHDPDKPFFLYLAHNAVHGPLQAKEEDIARHRGRYDEGWDALRDQRFAAQLAAGLFPPGTALPDRNSEAGLDVPAWDSLTADQQRRYARYMEVYAAMVDNIDQNLGRLTATLEALGELDNTVIVFTSDNGGTGEGGAEGTRSYFSRFVHHPRLPGDWEPDVDRDPDLIGGPRSLVHYPRGWGMASNTPFRLYKGHTYAGGVRVPFVLSWPRGVREGRLARGLRTQYQYVTDITPTLLELAGTPRPDERRGTPLQEVDGASFAPVLADPAAGSTHPEQYCEMTGNRSYYRDGHKLVTLHRPGTPYDDAEWALYDLRTDPTEIHDLADQRPEVIKELAAAWEQAAWRNGVFPLPDGSGALAHRHPADERYTRELRLLPGTPELERYRSSRLIAFRSFGIAVRLESYADGDQGVLVSHGDQGGGYSLYVEDGRLRFAYNEYGRLHETDAGPLPPGTRDILLTATAEQGLRWHFTLTVDGAERPVPGSVHQLIGMAPFQGISVGIDRKSPVSWPLYERHRSFRYNGRLRSVTYRPGAPGPDAPETVAQTLREAAAAFE